MTEAIDRSFVASRLEADLRAAADSQAVAEIVGGVLGDPGRMGPLTEWARESPEAAEAWAIRVRAIRGAARGVDALQRRWRAPRRPTEAETVDGVPEEWAAPVPYEVLPSGVWRVDDQGRRERVASRPVWPVGYLRDVDGDGYSVVLQWVGVSGEVQRVTVDAATVADSRGLVALARHGLPVTTATARHLAAYVDAAITSNAGALEVGSVARRLGWMPGGGFLLGPDYLGPEDHGVSLAPDPGLRQMAESYRPAGSWEGWLSEVVDPGGASPMLWVGLYNAVASILIRPVGLGDPWAIDRSGETSRGKSTLGRAAFSVWANPRARPSWSTSLAGIEARAAQLADLPLSLDDSKKARRHEDVAAVVYMHSGGTGRTRGAPGSGSQSVSSRPVSRWWSTLDSDGEQSLTSFTRDAGARARVLVMTGDPLPDGETATRVGLGSETHWGHLGRRALEALQAPGALERYRQRWPVLASHWRASLAPYGAVAGRLSRIVAALALARELAEEAGLPEPPPGIDPIAYAAVCARQGGRDADVPAEALRHVYGLAARNMAAFFGQHDHSNPPREWFGKWGGGDEWDEVAIEQSLVRSWLDRGGFDGGIVERWAERGWLAENTGRGRRVRRRVNGRVMSCYGLTRAAVEEILGADSAER